jgi:predicted alpha/beta hydrolase
MFRQNKEWETRESAFAAFATGPLTDFWRQREEAEFTGVDNIPVRFVRFHAARHDRVIVVCPGRIESYVKYAELAYDLFHLGFDVLIIDHRGQGRSGRLLEDSHRGHVVNFSDYVDDLTAFWEQEVTPGPWRKRYILAHSMGARLPRSLCNATHKPTVMPLPFARRCSALLFTCRTGWCVRCWTGRKATRVFARIMPLALVAGMRCPLP